MIRRAHDQFPPRGTQRGPAGRTRPHRTRPEHHEPTDARGADSILAEIVHPDLIPAVDPRSDRERAAGTRISGLDRGETLEDLLRRWGGSPLPGWRRRCPGGIREVLDSFARLARLLGELSGAGLPAGVDQGLVSCASENDRNLRMRRGSGGLIRARPRRPEWAVPKLISTGVLHLRREPNVFQGAT